MWTLRRLKEISTKQQPNSRSFLKGLCTSRCTMWGLKKQEQSTANSQLGSSKLRITIYLCFGYQKTAPFMAPVQPEFTCRSFFRRVGDCTASYNIHAASPCLSQIAFYNVSRVWKDFLPVGLLEEIFVFVGKGLALECCNLWCSHYFYHDFLSTCSSLGKSISRPNFKEPGAAKRRAEEVVRL